MSRYLCAIPTIVMFIFLLPASPVRVKAADEDKTTQEAPKSGASTEDQAKPKFEVISIKRVPYNDHYAECDFHPGGRFKAHISLSGLIAEAYEIPLLQVVGIPGSFEKIFWDIQAKPEEGKYSLKNGILDPHVGRLMIQSMLEDRFKLKVHRETRILPGYELVTAKGGPRLTSAKNQEKRSPAMFMPGSLKLPSVSLTKFASSLTTILHLWEGDKNRFHVEDKTGLDGLYEIHLRWTPDLSKAPGFPKEEADQSGITFFEAIQDQLGLKLVPAKVPVPVVIIDEVQMPTTN